MAVHKPKVVLPKTVPHYSFGLTKREKYLWSLYTIIFTIFFGYCVYLLAVLERWIQSMLVVSQETSEYILIGLLIASCAIIYYFPLEHLVLRPLGKLRREKKEQKRKYISRLSGRLDD